MVEHIRHWAPKNAVDLNLQAIEVGFQLVS
jgi:hypothetical protein